MARILLFSRRFPALALHPWRLARKTAPDVFFVRFPHCAKHCIKRLWSCYNALKKRKIGVI
jgi:hypothetical protein